ncbi:MAG: MFS transporter [Pseudomonadota bacterium]
MKKLITNLSCLKYAVLALPLAFAGLPIYVHVPKFYAQIMEINLASLGILLFCTRLADTFIDPLIGVLSDKFVKFRRLIIIFCLPILALGYFLLFSPPNFAYNSPLIWLGCCLLLVYISFSTLMINYYAIGIDISGGEQDNTKIATWREGFMLLGVLLASLLPPILMQQYDLKTYYQIFGIILAPLLIFSAFFTLVKYQPILSQEKTEISFLRLLESKKIRYILLLAFFNAIPTAITSTLFMFFTSDVLKAPEQSGFMLSAYFLSAAISTPFWNYLSGIIGKRKSLLIAMILSIICFIWAWTLGANDIWNFYIICVLSGITMGADVVLMPSLFADALSDRRNLSATAFGLWNLTSKLTMAFAAILVLPLLSQFGYHAAMNNNVNALSALSFCYAILPCVFKAGAASFLYFNSISGDKKL